MRRLLPGIFMLAFIASAQLGSIDAAAGAGPDLILHDAVLLTMNPDARVLRRSRSRVI